MTTGQPAPAGGAPRPPMGGAPRPGGPPRTFSGPRPGGGGGQRPGGGGQRPGGGGQRRGRPRYYARRKVCGFCVDKIDHIDYKRIDLFRRYLSDRFRIEARRKTGVCSKHQRGLSTAIKRARYLAMIPYTPDHRVAGIS